VAGWSIADVTVERIEEFSSPGFPPQMQFPDYTPAIFDRHPELRQIDRIDPETGNTFASIHAWLVRAHGEIILVDTASGNAKSRTDPKFARFHMLDTDFIGRLADAGVKPEDVTCVINTHMHVDHSGWNTRFEDGRWVPTFPNATYVFGAAEYRNWQPGGVTATAQPEGVPVIEDSIEPVVDAGLVRWVGDGDELLPGFTFHAAPGHTSGQLVLRVHSGGQSGWFTGDVMHRAMQVFEPDLNCFLCEDNDQAPLTRARLLEVLASEDALIFPAHFDRPHAGRIAHRGDGGFRFEPVSPSDKKGPIQ
jgi:glyoxylase-like metal-dependent hydrolase (beta-lactamase superfamily II)